MSALALILWLSLFSYHAHDPGFSDTGEPGPVGNWIGPVGAWLSRILLIHVRPAGLSVSGHARVLPAGSCTRTDPLPEVRSRANSLLRAAGFVLTLLTSCGLATLHWDGSAFPDTAGGVLGELIGQGSGAGV